MLYYLLVHTAVLKEAESLMKSSNEGVCKFDNS